MARATYVNLPDIRRDLASPNAETRGHALHLLYVCLDRQPELHAAARDIFRHAAEYETYGWVVITGVLGLEHLDGPDAARPHWRRLLGQPDALAAGRAAMSAKHPSHLPMLVDLIERRPEFVFRRGAIYALGWMRDPSVIPLLLRLGEDVALQQHVVQALSDIGDPQAVPWLRTLESSDRRLPEMDERGATLTLGEIAGYAIRSIEHRGGQRSQPNPAATPAAIKSTAPPPLSRRPSFGAARPPAWRPWSLLHPSLIPLIAAALELVLLLCLFALIIVMAGNPKPTFALNDRVVDAIALPLPVIGLIAAVTLKLGGLAPRLWHNGVALVGALICCFFVCVFGFDFMTR